MKLERKSEKYSGKIDFSEWNWGDFDFNKLISKRVAEVLEEELKNGDECSQPYIVMSSNPKQKDPLEITVGWPFSDDVFFKASIPKLMRELVDDQRVGGDGTDGYIDDEDGMLKRTIVALRKLADDMERWVAGKK